MTNKMPRYFLILVIVASWVTISVASRQGALEYQGVMRDSSGAAVPDGKYGVGFAIYDRQVDGNALWKSATYTIVATSKGGFECKLGETNPLPDSLAQFDILWLEIIADSGESDNPRLLISSSDIVWNSAETYQPQSKSSKSMKLSGGHYAKAAGGLIIKVGRELDGDHKFYANGQSVTFPVDNGTMAVFEAYWQSSEKPTLIGGGLEIEIPRPVTNFEGDFQFISFYGAMKIKIFKLSSHHDYFTASGKLGYGFLFGDNDYKGTLSLGGGLHMGAGVGALIHNLIVVEAFYVVNKGSMGQYGNKLNVQYSRISLTTGVYLGN